MRDTVEPVKDPNTDNSDEAECIFRCGKSADTCELLQRTKSSKVLLLVSYCLGSNPLPLMLDRTLPLSYTPVHIFLLRQDFNAALAGVELAV